MRGLLLMSPLYALSALALDFTRIITFSIFFKICSFIILIFNMVCNCRAEISPRPVSQDVHLCTTFYLYRLNYVAHTLQLLWTASSQFLSLQTITLPVPTDNTFQIALFFRIYLTWNIATLSTVISRITTPYGSQHRIEYEL